MQSPIYTITITVIIKVDPNFYSLPLPLCRVANEDTLEFYANNSTAQPKIVYIITLILKHFLPISYCTGVSLQTL